MKNKLVLCESVLPLFYFHNYKSHSLFHTNVKNAALQYLPQIFRKVSQTSNIDQYPPTLEVAIRSGFKPFAILTLHFTNIQGTN